VKLLTPNVLEYFPEDFSSLSLLWIKFVCGFLRWLSFDALHVVISALEGVSGLDFVNVKKIATEESSAGEPVSECLLFRSTGGF